MAKQLNEELLRYLEGMENEGAQGYAADFREAWNGYRAELLKWGFLKRARAESYNILSLMDAVALRILPPSGVRISESERRNGYPRLVKKGRALVAKVIMRTILKSDWGKALGAKWDGGGGIICTKWQAPASDSTPACPEVETNPVATQNPKEKRVRQLQAAGCAHISTEGFFAMSETIAGLEVHPVAALYPLLDEESFKELFQSVMMNGVIHPIIVDQNGRIVDGRNRARAWKHASIIFKDSPEWAKTHELKIDRRTFSATPEGEQQEADCLSGDIEDAICQYIAAANLHRRHMAPEQKAAVILSVRQYRLKYAAECGKARAASQFKAGNQAAKEKETVNLISGSPSPERDLQKKNANSSNGKIAEASGASRYVVEELAALQKANPEAFAAVAARRG